MDKPDIIDINERSLVGMRIRTSLDNDKTRELWQRFKPRVKKIKNKRNNWF